MAFNDTALNVGANAIAAATRTEYAQTGHCARTTGSFMVSPSMVMSRSLDPRLGLAQPYR